MATQKFAYSSLSFIIWGVVISIFFVFCLVLVALMSEGISVVWIGGLAALYIISLLIFSVLPIMSRHVMTDHFLLINQGIIFRKKLAWEKIAKIEAMDDEIMSSGVYASVRKPRVVVTSRRFGLIAIRLKEKDRFGYAWGKLADELIIDVRDTERFLSEANKRLSGD